MSRDKRPEKPLWVQLRDTHGRDLPSSVPFSTLLAAHPSLRSKSARELSDALGISLREADRAIHGYMVDAFPAELVPNAPGSSVDDRVALAGRPGPPGWVSGKGVASRVDVGHAGHRSCRDRFASASGINDEFRGVLPLGWAYRMPLREVVRDGSGAIVSLGAPTAFDAQVATILRGEVPESPDVPGLPRADVVRAFAVAMGGSAMIHTEPDGGFGFQVGGLPPSELTAGARGVVEDVGTWPGPQPGEVFPWDAIRTAYAAFRWYGVLPGDSEGPPVADWSSGDRVSRQRYVFWYLLADDGAWNKAVQVQGYSEEKKAWILPSKWGESIQVYVWRPTESQFVGEWTTFFSWDRWNNENKGQIMGVAVWVAALAVTVATLGAGAGALAAAATFQAAMFALQKLYGAIAAGDAAKAVAATAELGTSLNNASDKGDFLGAMKQNNPGLAKFTEAVAAPFAKVYQAAGGAAATVQSVWDQAGALRRALPAVDGATWGAAANAVGGAGPGALAWLQMARLPSSSEVASELWTNAPPWAKDLVAMGTALAATEQAQEADRFARSSVLQLQGGGGGGGGGGMMMMMRQPVAQPAVIQVREKVRAIWSSVPPRPVPAGEVKLAEGQPPPGGGGGVVILVVAAAAAAFLLLK